MSTSKTFKRKKGKANKVFNLNRRQTRKERGYTQDWYKYRFRFIHYNPKCYVCLSIDRINVDHVEAHKGNEDKFWDIYNLIPLCHSCHSTVTGLFDRHKKQKLEEKLKWLHRQREINRVTVKVKPVPLKG